MQLLETCGGMQTPSLETSSLVEAADEMQEDLYDVHVEEQCCSHIIVWAPHTILPHHQLDVEAEEDAQDEDHAPCNELVGQRGGGQGRVDACGQQDQQKGEDDAREGSEVLRGEKGGGREGEREEEEGARRWRCE